MTPHINANPGDFAETVLMPGDPLRAKYIADNYLEDAVLVNTVRNMFAYTGTYQGKRISVMAHGMGMPSVSIYATELIKEYGVKNIVRIGSSGALQENLKLGDVILATGAGTDSQMNRMRVNGFDFAATADFNLTRKIADKADELGKEIHVGRVFSSDYFYGEDDLTIPMLQKYGFLAIEMEVAALYGLAITYGAKASSIVTVTDHLLTGEAMSSEDRQTSLDTMITLALKGTLED